MPWNELFHSLNNEECTGVRSLHAEITSCHAAMFTFAGSKRALRPLGVRGSGRSYAFQNLGTPSQGPVLSRILKGT